MDQKVTENVTVDGGYKVRRHYTIEQKRSYTDLWTLPKIEEAKQLGSMSLVCRKYGISHSRLFEWRKQMEAGALSGLDAGEAVVPLSQVKELKNKIRELERLLGKKTVEVEILKEAVELGREKKLISHAPLHGVEGFR